MTDMPPPLQRILAAAQEGIGLQMDGLLSIVGITDWQIGMAQELTAYHAAAYIAGRGYTQLSQLSDADRRELSRAVGPQIDYLNDWADQLEASGVDPDRARALRARAALYAGNVRASYFRGLAARYQLSLPAYPGDGSTECLGNCRCMWELVPNAQGGIDAYWRMGAAEHCDTCPDRARTWAPYRG